MTGRPMRRRILCRRCIRRKDDVIENCLEEGISCLKASGIEEDGDLTHGYLLSLCSGCMNRTRYLMDRDMTRFGRD